MVEGRAGEEEEEPTDPMEPMRPKNDVYVLWNDDCGKSVGV